MSSDKPSRHNFIETRRERGEQAFPKYPLLSIEELDTSPQELDARLRPMLPEEFRDKLRPEEKVIGIVEHEIVLPDTPISPDEILRRASRAPSLEEIGKHGSSVASVNIASDGRRSRYEWEHGRDAEIAARDVRNVYPALLRATNLSLARSQGVEHEEHQEDEPFGFERPGSIILVNMDPDDPVARKFEHYLRWKPRFYASADAPALNIHGLIDVFEEDPNYFFENASRYESLAGYSTTLAEAFYLDCRWMLESRNSEGLIEYFNPVKKGGMRNQGWRDGAGAMVHADGSWANANYGVVSTEVQAVSFGAMMRAGDVFSNYFRNDRMANDLYEAAWSIKKFYAKYGWANSPEGGYVVLGFDHDDNGRLRPLETKAPLPDVLRQHLLSEDQALEYINTLLTPDIVTRWGARSMSSNEIAFAPFRYHEGKIWPHLNDALAAGMSEYGLYGADRFLGGLTSEACDLVGCSPETIVGKNSAFPGLSSSDVYVYNLLHEELYLADQAPPLGQTWVATAAIAKRYRYLSMPQCATNPKLRKFEETRLQQLRSAIYN